MSHIPFPEEDIIEAIMTAVNEVNSSEGASLDDIKSYIFSTIGKEINMERLQLKLNYAVDKGLLTKLQNGKYKMRRTSGSPIESAENLKKLSDELFLKFDVGNQKMMKTKSHAKEAAKKVESAVNEGLCSDKGTEKNETKGKFKFENDAHNTDHETKTNKGNHVETEKFRASSAKISEPKNHKRDDTENSSV